MPQSETQMEVKNTIVSHKKRENVILSSILFNRDCREYAIQNRIPTEFFDQPKIKKILDIFNGLVSSNLTASLEMLIEQFYPKDEDELNRKSLKKELYDLRSLIPPVELDIFKEHLHLLRKHKNLETLYQILEEAQKKIIEEKNAPSFEKKNKSLLFLQGKLDTVLKDFTPEEIKSLNLSEGLTKQLDTIYVRRKNPEIKETASTGYSVLNDIFSGGFRKGYFSLICARPAMGKTVVMLNQAVEAAKQGTKTLFISIEMSLEQCLQRVLSKISGVKMKHILQPEELNQSSLNNLETKSAEASTMYGTRLYIEEVNTITPSQLESRIKFYQKQFGVDLVFVDYIQIMRTNEGKIPKEASDFSGISSALRETSKATDIALVLGSQLSRDVEKRPDKRPMDSDLKNSGSFEQDAVALIHLYRDKVYNADTEDENILEIIVGKNRFGTGNVTLRFTYDYSIQTIYQNAPTATAA